MGRVLVVVGVGVGYVLGARAGRQRYEQIRDAATGLRDSPRVRRTTHRAVDVARASAARTGSLVRRKAPVAADRIKGLAGSAVARVRPRRSRT